MNALKEFNIVFSGLALGKHNYEYKIEKSFFDAFNYADFENIEAKVLVELDKQESLINIHFNIQGEVDVLCDSCGDDLQIHVATDNTLLVKFSDAASNEGDDLIVLTNTAYEINIAQYIYEYLSLAIPQRRAHEEDCLEYFDEAEVETVEETNSEEEIDPRWKALEQLKGKSKQ